MYHRIKATKHSLFFTIIILLVSLLILKENLDLSNKAILLMSSVVFVYGFYINILFNLVERKFFGFLDNFSKFFGDLASFYKITCLIDDKDLIKETRKIINDILDTVRKIRFCDFEKTEKNFFKLFGVVKKIKPKSFGESNYHSRMIGSLISASEKREVLELMGDHYLEGGMKYIFVLVNLMLIITLMTIVRGPYTLAYSVVFIFVILFASITLKDIDHFKYGETSIKQVNISMLRKAISENF